MNTNTIAGVVFLVAGAGSVGAWVEASRAAPQDAQQDGATRTEREAAVRHGEYIVHDVAMCVQCHTPRKEGGELVEQKELEGAPVPVDSPFGEGEWAARAPAIAGLPGGWSEEDLSQFLRTGRTPHGESPAPPMPPFRMNERDAGAVAAYLASME